MILPNNPDLNVGELMARVRHAAAKIRASGSLDEIDMSALDADVILVAAIDRQRSIAHLIDRAAERSEPRTELPKRLAMMPAPFGALRKPFLNAFNYVFKQQREVDDSLIAALRDVLHVQTVLGERVRALSDEIRDLKHRLSAIETQTPIE